MIDYPNISPEILRIGPVAIRWYGLMYLLGFTASYLLVYKQINDASDIQKTGGLTKEGLENLYTYLIFGLLIGARFGYIIIYNASYYLYRPWEVLYVWQGGMSFHGGLIGSIAAGYIVCKKRNLDFWKVADLVIVTAPIGLGLGRIGNFINAELYGRPTDVPWAMIFPGAGPVARHPSQLYEFALEGVLLFIILWSIRKRFAVSGYLTSVFLILYGIFRSIAEIFREPDAHIGFFFGIFTIGQLLSFSMIAFGFAFIYIRRYMFKNPCYIKNS